MRILCRTEFDITATGVSGNHSRNRLPFQDAAGESITDIEKWNRSRNRQRNWETVQQILNLRTLLEEITTPEKTLVNGKAQWSFQFQIDRPSSLELNGDPVGALKLDCEGVPMILNLDETPGLSNYLIYGRNITFEIINK